jgi:hypothetical protein
LIEGAVDASVQLVESGPAVERQADVVSDRLENGGCEWRVDAVEKLEKQDADAEALRRQAVRLGLRHFENQALGAQFGQVVAQLAQTVRGGGRAKGFGGALMEISGPKTAAS